MQPSPGANTAPLLSGAQITLSNLASQPGYKPQRWHSAQPSMVNPDGWLGIPDPEKFSPGTVCLTAFELGEEKRKGNVVSLKDLQRLPLQARHAWISQHYEHITQNSEQQRRHSRYSVHEKFNLVAFLLNKKEFKEAGSQPLPDTDANGPIITVKAGGSGQLPMTTGSTGAAGGRPFNFLGDLGEAQRVLGDYMRHNIFVRLRDGTRLSFWNLAKYVEENPELEAMVRRDMREFDTVHGSGMSRLDRLQSLMPWQVRPSAPKMMLPLEEEKKLPFGLVANSNVWARKPTPWLRGMDALRDFAYALYAHEEGAADLLGPVWGGIAPERVLGDPDFHGDLLRCGPELGMALMAVASRDLPLQQAGEAWGQRVAENLERMGAPEESYLKLGMLGDMMAPGQLAGRTKLLTEDGTKLREGSTLLLCTTPGGRMLVQAMCPGRLKEKETYTLGALQDWPLCWAVLGTFIGPNAHDPEFVQRAGKRMLFYINGFKSRNADDNPDQMIPGDDFPFQAEALPASANMFTLPPVGHAPYPTLLNRVSDSLAYKRVMTAFERAAEAAATAVPAKDPQVTYERRRDAAELSMRSSLDELGLPVEALLRQLPGHRLLPLAHIPATRAAALAADISSAAEPLSVGSGNGR